METKENIKIVDGDADKKLEGFAMFQKRTLELAGGDQDKADIANKMAEVELDFEFVKDLNTQLANKYQELMDCFPTSTEIDVILEAHKEVGSAVQEERTIKLKKFRSALVALEKQDPTAKPQRYDELFNGEKNE